VPTQMPIETPRTDPRTAPRSTPRSTPAPTPPSRAPAVLFPAQATALTQLGERVRLARLRRNLTMAQTAERAQISRETLKRLETGDAGSSLGVLIRVLKVLGLDKDLNTLAADDVLGRKLQDLALPVRKRASKVVRDV
jgi:DNA-binding XRE family transcriptional regulator